MEWLTNINIEQKVKDNNKIAACEDVLLVTPRKTQMHECYFIFYYVQRPRLFDAVQAATCLTTPSYMH